MEDETSELRFVAAAFADREEAAAAERELRGELDVGPADIATGEVGGDPSKAGMRGLLAGRFRAHRRTVVERVVDRHRGKIVADIPESRATPSPRRAEAPEGERSLRPRGTLRAT